MYPAPVKRCEMVRVTRRRAAIEGFAWGVFAGLVLVALMYLASALLGLRPLPQALNDPLLSIMPGFVFGFLIVQNRIDRRDPKLALASVAADDTIEFRPPPSRGQR